MSLCGLSYQQDGYQRILSVISRVQLKRLEPGFERAVDV